MTDLAGKIVSLIGRFARCRMRWSRGKSSGAAGSCGAGCRTARRWSRWAGAA